MALVLAARAAAAGARQPGEGALVLRDAAASTAGVPAVTLAFAGAALGQLAQGRVVIDRPPGSGVSYAVTGERWKHTLTSTATAYGGKDVRFRVTGPNFVIRVYGSGININAVGRGRAVLSGAGQYSLNGNPFAPLTATGVQISVGGG